MYVSCTANTLCVGSIWSLKWIYLAYNLVLYHLESTLYNYIYCSFGYDGQIVICYGEISCWVVWIKKNYFILFGIFEMIFWVLNVIPELLDNLGFEDDFRHDLHIYTAMIENLGVPVILQALGNVNIKITSDPLEGISKLDCLQIVS